MGIPEIRSISQLLKYLNTPDGFEEFTKTAVIISKTTSKLDAMRITDEWKSAACSKVTTGIYIHSDAGVPHEITIFDGD
jgi:hypothetical protein